MPPIRHFERGGPLASSAGRTPLPSIIFEHIHRGSGEMPSTDLMKEDAGPTRLGHEGIYGIKRLDQGGQQWAAHDQ